MSPPPDGGHGRSEYSGYLDSASGIPGDATAGRSLGAAAGVGWPDPGRRYPRGRAARELLDQSRSAVARVLDVPAAGVCFAGSVEEAVWWALTGFLTPTAGVALAAVEDVTWWRAADRLAQSGTAITTVAVDRSGRVAPGDIAGSAGPGDVVVLQDGNLEIGTRQPLAAVRAELPDTTIVTDGRAVLGRVPPAPGWDVLVADARMWGGTPGVALVAVRNPGRFAPWVAATDGHRGVEPALPAIPAIAASALALEQAVAQGPWQCDPLVASLRDRVTTTIPDTQVVGDPAGLPYLVMFAFLYVPADELVDELARLGWSVASGASCTSDTRRPHHVLVAVGALTHGSLRVSIGPWTTPAELDEFASDLAGVVARIRAELGTGGL